jgi:hypothetical protein
MNMSHPSGASSLPTVLYYSFPGFPSRAPLLPPVLTVSYPHEETVWFERVAQAEKLLSEAKSHPISESSF